MIYSFIVTSNQKNFIREYHVPAEYSLYDFRRFIENDLEVDDSQQVVFFILDEQENKKESYSLFNMDTVILEDLKNSEKLVKMLYTFDVFNDRSLTIMFQEEVEPQPRVSYPIVYMSKGDNPNQFNEKPVEDEFPDISNENDYEEEDLLDLKTDTL